MRTYKYFFSGSIGSLTKKIIIQNKIDLLNKHNTNSRQRYGVSKACTVWNTAERHS